MKRFAIIGVGGYVAPRHLRAIKDTGNILVAAMDTHDSVGILDSFFPDANFFTEFERFERFLNKLKNEGRGIDYLVVCTPNYLHDSHVRFGLKLGADVICEKPLALNPHNVKAIRQIEGETQRQVFTILQLRLQPILVQLKERLSHDEEVHQVRLNYITPRGKWYQYSWKGDKSKSGGLATNIGIHLFDILIWLFGNVRKIALTQNEFNKMSGQFELDHAHVSWYLSIDVADMPKGLRQRSYRALEIDGERISLDHGFEDLHTQSYQQILAGKGFTSAETLQSIDVVSKLREMSGKEE